MTQKRTGPDSNTLKTIGRHFLVYSAAESISKMIGFFMLPVYAHYLRGEGYGIIGMIDVVTTVMLLLIGQGLGNAMTRLYYERKTDSDQKTLVSSALIVMSALVVVIAIPALIFNRQIAWLAFGSQEYANYIIIAIATFVIGTVGRNALGYILIQQKSVLFSIISLLKLVAGLSLNIFFIVYLEWGVLGYLLSGLIVTTLFSIFFCAYTISYVGFRYSKDDARALLSYNLPLIPGYFAGFLRNSADRVIIRVFMGLSMVGTYEMLYKFVTLIGVFIVQPISRIYNVKKFEIAETSHGPATLARFFTLQLALMFFIGLILSVEIPIVLKILTPKEFWVEGWIIGLAVLGRIGHATYLHLNFGLLYAKKTHKISIIQGMSAVVGVTFSFILTRSYGLYGAIVGSFLTILFQCIIAYRMSHSYYPIPFEWRKILILTGSVIMLYLGIDSLNFSELGMFDAGVRKYLTDPIVALMNWLKLDGIKDGKLIYYVTLNLPLLIDGIVKLISSLSVIVVFLWIGVITPDKLTLLFKPGEIKRIMTDNE